MKYIDKEKRLDIELKIQELEARIDGLCGGGFSKAIKP